MPGMMPDSDSEDDLPPGWEERATVDGSVYYVNHSTKSTQWTHPRTGKKKKVAGELPFGWEKVVEDSGKILYVDHENHRTTYTDPRLAFAQEEKDTPLGFRQRFDGSSTALQVLHGRDLSGRTAIVTGANCGIGDPKLAENTNNFQDEISKPPSYTNRQELRDNNNHKPIEEKPKFNFSSFFDYKQVNASCYSDFNRKRYLDGENEKSQAKMYKTSQKNELKHSTSFFDMERTKYFQNANKPQDKFTKNDLLHKGLTTLRQTYERERYDNQGHSSSFAGLERNKYFEEENMRSEDVLKTPKKDLFDYETVAQERYDNQGHSSSFAGLERNKYFEEENMRSEDVLKTPKKDRFDYETVAQERYDNQGHSSSFAGLERNKYFEEENMRSEDVLKAPKKDLFHYETVEQERYDNQGHSSSFAGLERNKYFEEENMRSEDVLKTPKKDLFHYETVEQERYDNQGHSSSFAGLERNKYFEKENMRSEDVLKAPKKDLFHYETVEQERYDNQGHSSSFAGLERNKYFEKENMRSEDVLKTPKKDLFHYETVEQERYDNQGHSSRFAGLERNKYFEKENMRSEDVLKTPKKDLFHYETVEQERYDNQGHSSSFAGLERNKYFEKENMRSEDVLKTPKKDLFHYETVEQERYDNQGHSSSFAGLERNKYFEKENMRSEDVLKTPKKDLFHYETVEQERYDNQGHSSSFAGLERNKYFEKENMRSEDVLKTPKKDLFHYETVEQERYDNQGHSSSFAGLERNKYFEKENMRSEDVLKAPKKELFEGDQRSFRQIYDPFEQDCNYMQQGHPAHFTPDQKRYTDGSFDIPQDGLCEGDPTMPNQTYASAEQEGESSSSNKFKKLALKKTKYTDNCIAIIPFNYPVGMMCYYVFEEVRKLISQTLPSDFLRPLKMSLTKGAILAKCQDFYSKQQLQSIVTHIDLPRTRLTTVEPEDLEDHFTMVEVLVHGYYPKVKVFKKRIERHNKIERRNNRQLHVAAWEVLHQEDRKAGRVFRLMVDNHSLYVIDKILGWKIPYSRTFAEFSVTGFETARALARHGCHVVLACRSVGRASKAIEHIRAERPQALCTAVPLDLRSLKSVKEFVNTLRGDPQFNRGIDVLILNAGVFALPYSLTEDGLDTTFQVNYLSQFYLTLLLEEMLARAAPSRVVFVSSESHRFSTMNASNISEQWLSPKPVQFWSMMAYNDSKLCGVVAARELARRWVTRDICVFSCHPGNMVSSDLSRHWCPYRLLFTLVRPFTKSLEQAASTQVYCASALELSDVSGLYFNNCCRCEPSKSSQDSQLAAKLWRTSLDLIGSHFSSLDIPDKYRHKR